MKKHLCTLLLFSLAVGLNAQNLPIKHVTIFKNGKSLLFKSGKVQAKNGRHSMAELPDALFGTYWVAGDELSSVFTVQDSVNISDPIVNTGDILRKNLGKKAVFYVAGSHERGDMTIIGVGERLMRGQNGAEYLVVKTESGAWATIQTNQIRRFDFSDAPDFNISAKKAQKRLDLNFKTQKAEQEIGLSYLVNNLGWMPVYRLELLDKTKGRLSLRAEIANDAEDLGDAELRLAVGIPNFTFANKKSLLFDFGPETTREDFDPYRGNAMSRISSQYSNAYQIAFDAETYEERVVPMEGRLDGSQAEDFYFYSIRPGNFPKNSRYQFPIFETDVQPTHFYECNLPSSNTQRPYYYQEKRSGPEEKIPVTHYVEFKNMTNYPWTTGAANLLSQSKAGLQPLSQDMLPYTVPGATCKVKIAQTPEIKITHGEGDVDRVENAKKFFSTTYDKVKIEAQVLVVNYKTEPVTLKICRSIEGTPLKSEQKWTLKQEQATLRVNPSYNLEWVVELKPGEERKWTYSYEVFVNM
ncbi:MAG: DUF4139 domain-containing protein [Saprospiraceae bacterium]|nr:DUF4139 domain-containing protein [Saprospiraceae bacterium]